MPKALVDCDAFFASCEQSRNPSLKGKSILVSGAPGTRSIVSSASYPAKVKGVRAGMSPAEALRLCPESIIVEGDFSLYSTYNRLMDSRLRTYGFPVEVSSIDEFYLDMDCSYDEAVKAIKDFASWVRSKLGITVSAGIAPTRTLAKLASEMRKPDGLTVLMPCGLPGSIAHLGVDSLLGVGKVTSSKLKAKGIKVLGDLLSADKMALEGTGYTRDSIRAVLAGTLEGNPAEPNSPPESISCRMTLPYDTTDEDLIFHCLNILCDLVSSRLRKQGLAANRVSVTARYEDYSTSSLTRSFDRSVSTAYHVSELAFPLWREHYNGGKKLRMLGIALSLLGSCPEGINQLPLLREDAAKLLVTRAIDRVRNRYGDAKLFMGSLLIVTKNPGRRNP